ncbi:MAG: acyl-ACP--UDP-N-acetylglucosamine O-acyltransferase [Burkholderiales bacterium]
MTHVDRTALVDSDARLGQDVEVGPYAVIEKDVEIGDGCRIAAHAVIKRYTCMGQRNRIHEHAVLGGEPQDFKFRPCTSHVDIGDDNIIREGVTLHRASKEGQSTTLGNDNFLMAYCHVAHDCTIGNRVIIANNALLSGHVTVYDRAFISGSVVIHQFCRVGTLAMLSGSAQMRQDGLPFVISDGVPGRARGVNVVGLERAGISQQHIREIRRAYRLLLMSGTPLKDALARLSESPLPEVKELIGFIQDSTRGFAHHRA